MSEAEAKERLELMVLAEEDPELSDDQLDDLVERARRPDAEGLVYGETGWGETWDLDAAAAEGWTRKAALAANRFNFGEDGQTFQRSQVYSNCIAQAQRYAAKGMGSITVASEAA